MNLGKCLLQLGATGKISAREGAEASASAMSQILRDGINNESTVPALMLRAKARTVMGKAGYQAVANFRGAETDLMKAASLQPGTKEIVQAQAEVQQAAVAREEEDKGLYLSVALAAQSIRDANIEERQREGEGGHQNTTKGGLTKKKEKNKNKVRLT